MFRKMAIALVAASVFTAPVLAQNTLSGGGTTSTPSTDAMDKTKPEKSEKSAESIEKSEKSVTRHHRIARHHRHGSKAAMSGKHPSGKAAKLESRRLGHGRVPAKKAYGRASKHMPSGTKAH